MKTSVNLKVTRVKRWATRIRRYTDRMLISMMYKELKFSKDSLFLKWAKVVDTDPFTKEVSKWPVNKTRYS